MPAAVNTLLTVADYAYMLVHSRAQAAIVSASLDAYLDPLAPLLGVDHVLCTKLGVGADGRLDGTLAGGNVRGAAKVERVRSWLGATSAEIWAYGDSAGDNEMLALADHAVRITRRTHLTLTP